MDLLQEQVAILNVKVDALHQTIEGLSQQLGQVLSAEQFSREKKLSSHAGIHVERFSHASYMLDGEMEHKDILSDLPYSEEHQSGERSLTPEVQIQRLTAQLTAAYNRIAALEEQLLSKRIH